ncbi:MAG: glycosyltransferase family 2 protein [Deltaproteobacteria bacterium]|nr:glycosyltransferase family 2 protein [Deltaproteobacteria bacterium]
MPKISVVIPTYNRAWCLARAVQSVLAQDHPDFECIVVDDGSTDETPKLLAGYPEVRVIRQENRGVSAARNRGAKEARGRWLAFLDSDDEWLAEKLSAQMKFFADNPEILICQTQEKWMKNGREVRPKPRHEKPSGMAFCRMVDLCLVSPSAVMIDKDLFFSHGGFDESLPACEDFDLWLKIGRTHPLGLVDEALVVKHGGHEDQLSAMPGLDRFRVLSLARIIGEGGLSPDQLAAAKRALAEKAEVYAAGCEKRGRQEEASEIRGLAARALAG